MGQVGARTGQKCPKSAKKALFFRGGDPWKISASSQKRPFWWEIVRRRCFFRKKPPTNSLPPRYFTPRKTIVYRRAGGFLINVFFGDFFFSRKKPILALFGPFSAFSGIPRPWGGWSPTRPRWGPSLGPRTAYVLLLETKFSCIHAMNV